MAKEFPEYDIALILIPFRYICTSMLNQITLNIQVVITTDMYWILCKCEPSINGAESEPS